MMKIPEKIAVFGDSIMKGVLYNSADMKYTLLKENEAKKFSDCYGVEVKNYSLFGCTVDKGEEKVEKMLSCDNLPSWVLLEYGGNDCDFDWKEVADAPDIDHQPHTPMEKFLSCYRGIIRRLRDKGIKPILMNLPPVDSEKYLKYLGTRGLNTDNILHWLGDAYTISRWQEQYSNAVEKLATEEGLDLVDVRTPFLRSRQFQTLLCDDGIHPTEAGHQMIWNAIQTACKA